MSSQPSIERRVARVARQCAKVICQLRYEGQTEGAKRLEAVAIETVDRMRRGEL